MVDPVTGLGKILQQVQENNKKAIFKTIFQKQKNWDRLMQANANDKFSKKLLELQLDNLEEILKK